MMPALALSPTGAVHAAPNLQPGSRTLQPGSRRVRHGSITRSTGASTGASTRGNQVGGSRGKGSRARVQCRASASEPGGGGGTKAGTPLSKSLEGVTVFKSDGTQVPVLSLWEDKRAVVAWVRHYGCLLCRKRAASLAEMKDALDAAEVTLAVIGPASVDQAVTFLEQTKFPGEVYADPEHASFEALQFANGVGTILNPKAGVNLVKARLQGFTQDWNLSLRKETVDRGGWQQGGVLVAGPGADNLLFLHKDQEAGDEPDMRRVKEMCCGAAAAT